VHRVTVPEELRGGFRADQLAGVEVERERAEANLQTGDPLGKSCNSPENPL
jgi:hypothetical protein